MIRSTSPRLIFIMAHFLTKRLNKTYDTDTARSGVSVHTMNVRRVMWWFSVERWPFFTQLMANIERAFSWTYGNGAPRLEAMMRSDPVTRQTILEVMIPSG